MKNTKQSLHLHSGLHYYVNVLTIVNILDDQTMRIVRNMNEIHYICYPSVFLPSYHIWRICVTVLQDMGTKEKKKCLTEVIINIASSRINTGSSRLEN